jgi:hypothetical protein
VAYNRIYWVVITYRAPASKTKVLPPFWAYRGIYWGYNVLIWFIYTA